MKQYNAKELVSTIKDHVDPKLGVSDYIALYTLSLRDWFWQIDGRPLCRRLLKTGNIFTVAAGMMLCMIGYLGWLPLCLSLVFTPLASVASALGHLVSLEIFEAIKMLLVAVFGAVFMAAVLVLWYIPMVTDWNRLRYNLRFTKSAWWKNTGIRPSEIKKDKGLYGEYIATMAAEQCLQRSKVYGRILNNVFIPKYNNDFTEIDIVSVNETGIHVIEAKARGGTFRGRISDKTWTQILGGTENEMDNPILQNNSHCNSLLEYLYWFLPAGSLRDKATFSWNAINVVLFTTRDITDRLTYDITPKSFFFGMATGRDSYQKLDIVKTFPKQFTPEEVDAIADALEHVAHFSREEQEQMIQDRSRMYAENDMLRRSGLLENKNRYYVAEVESTTADSNRETNVFLCHDNGDYLTYMDMDNGMFMAIPSGKAEPLSPKFMTLPEAMAAYRRITR